MTPGTIIDEKKLADNLGVSIRTIQAWRYKKIGPKFIKLSGRCVRYRSKDIEEYLQEREIIPEGKA